MILVHLEAFVLLFLKPGVCPTQFHPSSWMFSVSAITGLLLELQTCPVENRCLESLTIIEQWVSTDHCRHQISNKNGSSVF